MKYILLLAIFAMMINYTTAENVFVLDFSKGPSLLEADSSVHISLPPLEPPIHEYSRLNLGYEGRIFREPKFNFTKQLRENAERFIGGVIILGVAWRLYRRFQAESPVKVTPYESGVKITGKIKLGRGP